MLLLLMFMGCNKDDENPDPAPDPELKVYYISNEGAFGYGNASVSLFYPEEQKIQNDAFKQANNRRPGDVLQSIMVKDNKAYLVVNASDKIEIAASKTLKELGVLNNIRLPRYMITTARANTAYITAWGDGGYVAVMDLVKDKITDTIRVGKGPEKMFWNGGQLLLVANSGGFKDDSTLSVIDLTTNKVQKHLVLADNPVDICADLQSIWVLCRGKVKYDGNYNIIGHTPSYLYHLSGDAKVMDSIELFADKHPMHLEVSSDQKYLYIGGGYGFSGLYRFDINFGILETNPFINKDFYGVNVDPASGLIYGFEAPTFTASGKMSIYSPDGTLKNELTTGVGPNGITFSY